MLKNIFAAFLVATVITGLAFLFYRAFTTEQLPKIKPAITPAPTLFVTTSFYPLYFFVSEIGGGRVDVVNVTPAGAEPHDYEPSTQAVAAMSNSNLVVLNGAQLESWGEKITETLAGSKTQVISVADSLASEKIEEDGKNIQDPHVWLDPVLAKEEVKIITQELQKLNPEEADFYYLNSLELEKKLDALDTQFKKSLQNCQQKNIVTSHAAFGYVARRYGFTQIPIAGLSPDEEPSPKKLAELADFAKKNQVKYIFFETLVSPRLAETLAQEVGAQTLVFNPLEGLTNQEIEAGKDYFSVQQENLKNLTIALGCHE